MYVDIRIPVSKPRSSQRFPPLLQPEPRGVRDRFSRLAPELLLRVFTLAYEQEKPIAPLSRSLRPFYDAVKFDKITARSWRRIRSLLQTVTARPAFGSAVRELKLMDSNRDSQLSPGQVQALFALLPNLRELSISVSNSPSWLETVLPTREGAETALRASIKVLHVVSSGAVGAGYDAKVLATLKRLPNLENVQLDFPGSTANEADTSLAAVALPNIKHVQLGLHGNASTIGAFVDVVACFPHLQYLSLRAHTATCDFSPALSSVKAHKEVRELCLGGRPPLGWRFPEELAKFVALETLSLDGNFANISLEAYDALRCVPITTLQVKTRCDVSAAGLETLLGPRGSCPTLKVLQLDNLSAAYPPDFSREDFQDGEFSLYNYASNSIEAESFLYKFDIPTWTTQFSGSAYEHLVNTAKSHGVVVKGSTVVAREIDLVWKDLEDVVTDMREEEEAEEDRYGRGGFGDFPGDRWNPRLRSYSGYDDDEDEDGDLY